MCSFSYDQTSTVVLQFITMLSGVKPAEVKAGSRWKIKLIERKVKMPNSSSCVVFCCTYLSV